jgi:hypothetical protein
MSGKTIVPTRSDIRPPCKQLLHDPEMTVLSSEHQRSRASVIDLVHVGPRHDQHLSQPLLSCVRRVHQRAETLLVLGGQISAALDEISSWVHGPHVGG